MRDSCLPSAQDLDLTAQDMINQGSGLRKQLSTPGRAWQNLCNQINKAVIWCPVSGGMDMERHYAEQFVIIADLVLGFWLHIDVAQLTEDAWINVGKALWEQLVAARKLALSTPCSACKEIQFWGHHSFCYFWGLSPSLQQDTGAAFLYSWISFSVSPSVLFRLWCLGCHWGGIVVELFIYLFLRYQFFSFFGIVQDIPVSSRIFFSKPVVLTQ